ncbi:MAG TPA: twin-arginine translocase TatA/TatE family subunit [Ktedonobacterales bacterium]
MFNHLPELLGLLVLGLIVFGPKRMIEMGGKAGRMLRELRTAMKDLNWNPLAEEDSPGSTQSTLGKLSQMAQDFVAQRDEAAMPATTPTPPTSPQIVEATAQPTPQPASDPLAES